MGVMFSDCYTIWAEIDQQYNCAISVINDESYEPINPVVIDEFRQLQDNGVKNFRDKFSKVGEYILNTILLGVVGGFVYYALSS